MSADHVASRHTPGPVSTPPGIRTFQQAPGDASGYGRDRFGRVAMARRVLPVALGSDVKRGGSGVGGQVVVLDDDAESCRALCEVLTAEGFHALAFTSGETAWSAMESRQIHPDAVVSDIRMPGLDGVAFLRRVRARFPGVPVILVSAFPDDRTWSDALRLGALDVVPKPIRAGLLVRLLHDAARGGQPGSAATQTH